MAFLAIENMIFQNNKVIPIECMSSESPLDMNTIGLVNFSIESSTVSVESKILSFWVMFSEAIDELESSGEIIYYSESNGDEFTLRRDSKLDTMKITCGANSVHVSRDAFYSAVFTAGTSIARLCRHLNIEEFKHVYFKF